MDSKSSGLVGLWRGWSLEWRGGWFVCRFQLVHDFALSRALRGLRYLSRDIAHFAGSSCQAFVTLDHRCDGAGRPHYVGRSRHRRLISRIYFVTVMVTVEMYVPASNSWTLVEPTRKGCIPGLVTYVPWFPPGTKAAIDGLAIFALQVDGSVTTKTTTLESRTVAAKLFCGLIMMGGRTFPPVAIPMDIRSAGKRDCVTGANSAAVYPTP